MRQKINLILIFCVFYNFIKRGICEERRVNLTYTVWKGINCYSFTPFLNCTSKNLEPYLTKVYSFSEKDTLCVNIPGDEPKIDDPLDLIWPHSISTSNYAKTLSSWKEISSDFCNATTNSLQFTLFKNLNCKKGDSLRQGALPLKTPQPFINSPYGSQYNYTETFDCRIYTVEAIANKFSFLKVMIIFLTNYFLILI